ncbi:MAG: hypothetical protein COW18_13530 [Zetaproteobacteria bacterium CG12_big_fil_rev_8_21_14_0_65_54_13]|nr:MAG: hypothetical protein COX55_05425 [Zetaproteobacteria bacterium CG23_combo_of_CG06-09_8_20_14_all_54_7]PIW44216.1 MAG: hypothetical protein COW18_13530 [Zetaproteobacteria bacterium CG12_big_fil_rev_8_21_14_0_65_54_13]PIX54472.1 MAG: hypothetical protein COZ50_07810 [Zetaproteobacteria bacterium CG_4_10_14_3_um_filter_54_28]PJA26963.1 MAG: hypothetical protein CO188_13470 [Zetaproteobacteria bacterium CG_4_9_14_3_um_filter_54_145]
MTSSDPSATIASITKKQENIAVVIGVTFALTLCIYFFTYAMLVDKGYSGGLWLMGISSILMLLILIYLKPVSFFLTRLWLGRKPAYREAIAAMTAGTAADN